MGITIRDIAKMASVSTATVSRVLNNAEGVSPEVRKRIQDLIRSTGYQPNLIARGLATSRLSVFAFLCSDMTNLFYPQLARGVQDEANASGYQIVVFDTDDDPAKESRIADTVEQLRVSGVIHASVRLDHTCAIEQIIAAGIPCVLANRRLYDIQTDYVVADNVTGAIDAVEHLITKGHRRIGFIGGPDYSSNGRERLDGYRHALQRHGIPYAESLVRRTNFRPKEAQDAAFELLAAEPRPTAIFVQNDYLCLSVIDAVMELGLKIPQDVALVSFDGTALAESKALQLTTVSQRIREMGTRAAQILVTKNRNPYMRERHQVVFEPELIVRGSTAHELKG